MTPTQRFRRGILYLGTRAVLYAALLFLIGYSVTHYAPHAAVASYIVASVLFLNALLRMAAGLAGYASIKARVRGRAAVEQQKEEPHGQRNDDSKQP